MCNSFFQCQCVLPSPIAQTKLHANVVTDSPHRLHQCVLPSPATVCTMGQEPDPNSQGRPRWVIPVQNPYQCTEVRMGSFNTRALSRPYKVAYYDTLLVSSDPDEIRQWLNIHGKFSHGGHVTAIPSRSYQIVYCCSSHLVTDLRFDSAHFGYVLQCVQN